MLRTPTPLAASARTALACALPLLLCAPALGQPDARVAQTLQAARDAGDLERVLGERAWRSRQETALEPGGEPQVIEAVVVTTCALGEGEAGEEVLVQRVELIKPDGDGWSRELRELRLGLLDGRLRGLRLEEHDDGRPPQRLREAHIAGGVLVIQVPKTGYKQEIELTGDRIPIFTALLVLPALSEHLPDGTLAFRPLLDGDRGLRLSVGGEAETADGQPVRTVRLTEHLDRRREDAELNVLTEGPGAGTIHSFKLNQDLEFLRLTPAELAAFRERSGLQPWSPAGEAQADAPWREGAPPDPADDPPDDAPPPPPTPPSGADPGDR